MTNDLCLFSPGQVYLSLDGALKLGCLAQAMMVAPKNDASLLPDGAAGLDDEMEGEVDMEVEVNNKYDVVLMV